MILPATSKTNYIYLLLILVLLLSLCGSVVDLDFDFIIPQEDQTNFETALPESAVLHSVISARVKELTGETPVSVESDLSQNEKGYRLTRIFVVIRWGEELEVQNALEETFSFSGFVVSKVETP